MAASGNAGVARLRAAECRSIAQKYGFEALVAWAAIYEGWALVELGDVEEGLALLHAGVSAAGDFGMRILRPFHLGLAAAAKMRCEALDEAARSLVEAFAVAARSGHRFGLPELHRLRGELELRTGGDGDSRRRAVEDLRTAAEMAGATGAFLWEERARTALATAQKSGELKVV